MCTSYFSLSLVLKGVHLGPEIQKKNNNNKGISPVE